MNGDQLARVGGEVSDTQAGLRERLIAASLAEPVGRDSFNNWVYRNDEETADAAVAAVQQWLRDEADHRRIAVSAYGDGYRRIEANILDLMAKRAGDSLPDDRGESR